MDEHPAKLDEKENEPARIPKPVEKHWWNVSSRTAALHVRTRCTAAEKTRFSDGLRHAIDPGKALETWSACHTVYDAYIDAPWSTTPQGSLNSMGLP